VAGQGRHRSPSVAAGGRLPAGRATYRFEVPARRDAAVAARRRIDTLADEVDHTTLARARVLVGALVNRGALAHGDDPISVSVTVTAGGIRATVSGPGDEEPPALDWALLLVRRISDRWGFSRGIWFELDSR